MNAFGMSPQASHYQQAKGQPGSRVPVGLAWPPTNTSETMYPRQSLYAYDSVPTAGAPHQLFTFKRAGEIGGAAASAQ